MSWGQECARAVLGAELCVKSGQADPRCRRSLGKETIAYSNVRHNETQVYQGTLTALNLYCIGLYYIHSGLSIQRFFYAAFVFRCCDYKCIVDSHKTAVAFNSVGPNRARVMQKNTLSFLLIATTQPIRLMPAVDQITNRLPINFVSERRTIDLADDLYLTRSLFAFLFKVNK